MAGTQKQCPSPQATKASQSSAQHPHNTLLVIPKAADQFFSPAVDVQDGAIQDKLLTRHTKRTNAGISGQLQQLEKVGQAIEATPLPKAHVAIPDDEPVNIMAPTPHRPRKKKVQKKAASTDLQVSCFHLIKCLHAPIFYC